MSRRRFIGTVGGGVAGVMAGSALLPEGTDPRAGGPGPAAIGPAAGAEIAVVLEVDGRRHAVQVEPRQSLLEVLRDTLGLVATKVGCGRGECGACTVLIDGLPRYACMTLAVEAEGSAVTTVQGLMDGEELGPVQQAFVEEDGFQCGYCTPGQVMAAEGLLRVNPNPTLDEVREGMSGNLCRCAAYTHIANSVLKAAERRRQGRG